MSSQFQFNSNFGEFPNIEANLVPLFGKRDSSSTRNQKLGGSNTTPGRANNDHVRTPH
ncbi:uncharacterized protein METZ01_LOCUS96900 [marine metagenome]|uniref:Uncharacterized protein n=1 Tax=marine metagenome TaxID=408172 RepID=A0A381VUQ7_9ZZZZ